MNEKEIGEIRRRVRRDRSNMTAIYGCYVHVLPVGLFPGMGADDRADP